jgi:hypothetical protein
MIGSTMRSVGTDAAAYGFSLTLQTRAIFRSQTALVDEVLPFLYGLSVIGGVVEHVGDVP